ncbi:DEAD/DEAH box helicase [Tianweitania sp.]|uniref:DEAD/DEAH box helicase n=1 Tax=Tianweitania sp. TaxID=2021634 RepID=UPI0028A2B150|nr:DEAD/DEAH box helicase [Tianweitania sp.]
MQRSAFELLSEPVRKWIWQQKWPSLRDVQEKGIPAILSGGDVVISAKTAAGKTEAALLPLLTRIAAREQDEDGFAVLYVSPLKALINDQYRRLQGLCENAGVLLHKWHGDVSADAKARARRRPSGIVLITPESLEALLVRRGSEAKFLFSALDAVVIDELHAFIGSERGVQLASILNRIEIAAGRDRIDRIGLSATLGDMALAADALRPGEGAGVKQVHGLDEGNGVKLQIRGYLSKGKEAAAAALAGDVDRNDALAEPSGDGTAAEGLHEDFGVPEALASDLFRFLRGDRNLLFAGSRRNVEIYADKLRRMCEDSSLPNEFFPHHGSLSKSEREDVEIRLRDDPRPTTAVATTTLELGIDIGDVASVGQIGAGYSVASIRQRLGRSGRRAGKPAVLRIFVIEPAPDRGGHPLNRLNLDLIQSIAMVECLREGWCEPPAEWGLHLSTLLHQVLALIVQTGGLQPSAAWTLLCRRGPFRTVDRQMFADLLRCMASKENRLIEQSPEGLLMIGETGERITESHEFYPVFATEREYRVLHETKVLGTYPLSSPVAPGETIIYAGRRWKIREIDDVTRTITVKPTRGGKPPYFAGDGGQVHDRVVSTMREVLRSRVSYPYLDGVAARLLAEAREAYADLRLEAGSVISYGNGSLVFPWAGTKRLQTLTLAFLAGNFEAAKFGHSVEIQNVAPSGVEAFLRQLAAGETPEGEAVAARVAKPSIAKFDHHLSRELMTKVTLAERLDVGCLPEVARALIGAMYSDRSASR